MPRPKGSPNRNKMFLLNRLQDMYGEDFHPIMEMAKNASELQKLANAEDAEPRDYVTANKAWADIAEYTEPKLKSIDKTGEAARGASFISKNG